MDDPRLSVAQRQALASALEGDADGQEPEGDPE